MRRSNALIPTLKEKPSEAFAVSDELLLRAGMINKLTNGVFAYLPLGYKVLRNIEGVIRKEMDAAGAQEVFLSVLQPKSLWDETGRWEKYGSNMFKLTDRGGAGLGLGPTHEEQITDIARKFLQSYKQSGVNLYQIQTKFRDETRPRYGLIRCREFLMKDAYSFDTDEEGMSRSFEKMREAYRKIFDTLGIDYVEVIADSGAIGGTGSVEFIALADVGEDSIIRCKECDYASNLEAAVGICGQPENADEEEGEMRDIETPDVRTIEQLEDFLETPADRFIKTLVYMADGDPVVALVRGDHDVNEVKLKNAVGCNEIELADAYTIEDVTGAPVGFAGPVGLSGVPVYCDENVPKIKNAITGGNKTDVHRINVNHGRDYNAENVVDIRNAVEGENCVQCGGELYRQVGIEIGHIFKLGTVYSESMGANFVDENAEQKPFVMGCYGIGVSRLVSTLIEQNNDEKGIIWPEAVAPFRVGIVPVNIDDKKVREGAEELYRVMKEKGISVLYDDRQANFGFKCRDMKLIGIPEMVIVGRSFKKEGTYEVEPRVGESETLELDNLIARYK